MTFSDWAAAHDALPREKDLQTTDQKIAHAHVLALLAIAQELNHFSVGETGLSEALKEAAQVFVDQHGAKTADGGAW